MSAAPETTNAPPESPALSIARRLTTDILSPLKIVFVGKDEVIDLLGVCLAAGEHLFILGPPGTAKSAIVQELARRIDGRVFDYLLTRFTEPNELFGPFDIRRLREGDLVTNTEGMLPEASLVFLDELLNANSAILNSLLLVLNERVFRRGRETRQLPLLMVVGASNHLPEDRSLAALFDRFLMRVRCDNVADERLVDVLSAGWQFDAGQIERRETLAIDDVKTLQAGLAEVDLAPVRAPYVEVVQRLRRAGIPVSDRRAVKLQRLIAASSLLCARTTAHSSDLWVLKYIGDTEEQREVIAAIVQDAIDKGKSPATDHLPSDAVVTHPRSKEDSVPCADELARDLDRLTTHWRRSDLTDAERATVRDQLSVLGGRCQWVAGEQQRSHLQKQLDALWHEVGAAS